MRNTTKGDKKVYDESRNDCVHSNIENFAVFESDVFINDEGNSFTVPLLEEKEGKLQLRIQALRKLLDPAVLKDMPVAIVSIAGAYRMGKSFLLNLLLRYFKKQGWNDEKTGEWLRDWNSSRDNGINWRGGAKGDTRGIVAWERPIFVRKKDGTEIAVILLDTQGNFEHARKKKENIGVFALSTLFSSLQIFNVSKQIQTDDLEYLQCFVEFSKVTKPKTECAVNPSNKESEKRCFFQDLVFLVRDWHSPKDHQYGHVGGHEYLSNIMSRSGEKNEVEVHRYLRSAFTRLNCFLMPEPGSKVRILEEDTQILRSLDLGEQFFDKVTEFADKYFHPDKIPTKSIGFLENVSAEHLLHYMEKCAKGVLDGNLPNFPTMMQGVTEYTNIRAMEKAERSFKERFAKDIEEMEVPTWQAFDNEYLKEKDRAVELFLQSTHYGWTKEQDREKNWLIGHLENTKATMEEEMNAKRVRYLLLLIEDWLKDSVTKLQNHARCTDAEVQELQDIKVDCMRILLVRDHRDCSIIADILKEAEEQLERAYNFILKELRSKNSTANDRPASAASNVETAEQKCNIL